MSGRAMNDIANQRPWYVALIATQPERAKVPTAIEDALFTAVKRALYDPHHALHQQTLGFYRAQAATVREATAPGDYSSALDGRRSVR